MMTTTTIHYTDQQKIFTILNVTLIGNTFLLLQSSLLLCHEILLVNIRLHNLHKHNRKRKDESRNTQSPRRSKDRPEGSLERINSPNDSRTSTLNRFVEAGEVGQFSGFIGQCTHEPICVCLPCCVEETVEHVQEEVCGISGIEDVLFG